MKTSPKFWLNIISFVCLALYCLTAYASRYISPDGYCRPDDFFTFHCNDPVTEFLMYFFNPFGLLISLVLIWAPFFAGKMGFLPLLIGVFWFIPAFFSFRGVILVFFYVYKLTPLTHCFIRIRDWFRAKRLRNLKNKYGEPPWRSNVKEDRDA